MSKNTRCIRRFNHRPASGSIAEPSLIFSREVVLQTGESLTRMSDDEIITEAFQIVARRLAGRRALRDPQTTRDYVVLRFADLEHEVFTCIFVNPDHRVIACEELFRGTLDTASVHVREVAKRALALNAAGVVFAHNHPSNCAEPSQADEIITAKLRDGLAMIGVRVLDHLVVGGVAVTYFAERGLL